MGKGGPLAVIVAVALAGCAELPEPGTCGNGIVEPGLGETCDDGEDSATCDLDCRLKCVDADEDPPLEYVGAGFDPDGVAEFCPLGSTCGADDICRAPSGRFAADGPSYAIAGDQVEAGDVDGDQISDLIVVSTASIDVLYGSDEVDQAWSDSDTLATPTLTGRALALDYFNADESLASVDGQIDLLAPADGGLLKFVAKDGQLQTEIPLDPVDLSMLPGVVTSAGGPVVPTTIRDVDGFDRVLVAFMATGSGGGKVLVAGDPQQPAFAAACILGGGNWELNASNGVAVEGDRFAIAVHQGTAASTDVCIFSATLAGGLEADRVQIAPVMIDPAGGQLVFAEIDGVNGSCAELLIPGISGDDIALYPLRSGPQPSSGTPPYCVNHTLDPSPLEFVGAAPPIAPGHLVGAVDLLGNGIPELVFGSWLMDDSPFGPTVWQFNGTKWDRRAAFGLPTGQEWGSIAAGELDGSGRGGFVATRRTSDATTKPDLDVIRLMGADPDGAPLFQQQTLDTLSAVTMIAGGDYNGDALLDVAVVEAGEQGRDNLGLAFGRRGTVADGVTFVDDFPGGLLVARTGTTPSQFALARDGLDDLAVGLKASDGSLMVGLVFGTPLATLAAPQWTPGTGYASRPSLDGVVAVPAASGEVDQFDLSVFAPKITNGVAVTNYKWYWPALRVGGFDATDTTDTAGIEPGAPEMALAFARTTGGAAVVVGVSDQGEVSSDVPTVESDPALCALAPLMTTPGRPGVRAVDLDGVPGDELLIANRTQMTREVFLAPAFTDPCLVPTPVPASALTTRGAGACGDLAPIQALPGADGALGLPELAMVCDGPDGAGTHLVLLQRTDPARLDAYAPLDDTLILVPGRPFSVVPGDFNGDGVTDVALVTKVGSVTRVQLVIQCAEPDPDCGP